MSLPFVASLAATSASKESKASAAAKADANGSSGASFGEALKTAISDSSIGKEKEAHAKECHVNSEVSHSCPSPSATSVKSDGAEKKKIQSKDEAVSANVSASPVWLSALAYVSGAGVNAAGMDSTEASAALQSDAGSVAGQSIGAGGGRKKLSALSLLQSQHNGAAALADESDSMMGGSIGEGSTETLFNQLLPTALSSKIASMRNGSAAMDASASTVTLSSEWNASMISGVAMMQDSQGALAETVKTVRSVLQEYWVPPVNISTQSPTQATVQLNLQNGDTMRLQIDLGQAAHMGLRVEAPAALLADMQARLAPLQEALMQQGLTLLPIEWVAAKSSATRVNAIGQAGGVRSEQIKIDGKRKESEFFSDTSNESVTQQVVSMEDVLE